MLAWQQAEQRLQEALPARWPSCPAGGESGWVEVAWDWPCSCACFASEPWAWAGALAWTASRWCSPTPQNGMDTAAMALRGIVSISIQSNARRKEAVRVMGGSQGPATNDEPHYASTSLARGKPDRKVMCRPAFIANRIVAKTAGTRTSLWTCPPGARLLLIGLGRYPRRRSWFVGRMLLPCVRLSAGQRIGQSLDVEIRKLHGTFSFRNLSGYCMGAPFASSPYRRGGIVGTPSDTGT